MSEYLNERGFFKKTEFLEVAIVNQDYVFLHMDTREFPADTKPPEPFILSAPTITAGEKEAIKWDGNDWVIVKNHVDETWYKKETGEPVTIIKVGSPSEELTDKEKPGPFYVWDNKKNDWVVDKLLKQEFVTAQNTIKKLELKTVAEERITLLERKNKLKRATPEDLTMLDLLYGFTLDLDDLDLTQENLVFPEMPS